MDIGGHSLYNHFNATWGPRSVATLCLCRTLRHRFDMGRQNIFQTNSQNHDLFPKHGKLNVVPNELELCISIATTDSKGPSHESITIYWKYQPYVRAGRNRWRSILYLDNMWIGFSISNDAIVHMLTCEQWELLGSNHQTKWQNCYISYSRAINVGTQQKKYFFISLCLNVYFCLTIICFLHKCLWV